MATPDHSIDPRILESAKKEFLAHGFEKTSLKAICENAGITTGALYKRYKGKEDLFCALVADTVSDLNSEAVRKSADPETLSDEDLLRAWEMDVSSMMNWFQFLYERHDGFVLLLRCADGTVHADFPHEWVEVMTEFSYGYYLEARKRKLVKADISRDEMHILLTAFWTTVYEPFIHGFSWQEIEQYCQVVCKLFNWHEALGFSLSE